MQEWVNGWYEIDEDYACEECGSVGVIMDSDVCADCKFEQFEARCDEVADRRFDEMKGN